MSETTKEIKFKSSVKLEILLVILNLLFIISYSLTILFLKDFFKINNSFIFVKGFSMVLFLALISILLVQLLYIKIKKSYSYTFSNNGLINIAYKFISKYNNSYKLENITSFTVSQNFLEKILNIGTISFGFFGKNNSQLKENDSNISLESYGRIPTIKDYKSKFKFLLELNDIFIEDEIYISKPKSTIALVKFIFNLFLLIILYLGFRFMFDSLFNNSIGYIVGILMIIILKIFINVIINFINFFKLKNTTYSLTKNYIKIKYSYFLGSQITIIPYSKVINKEVIKSFLIYDFFKVGNIKIYTGGDQDPVIYYIGDFEIFSNKIEEKIKLIKENNTYENGNKENEIKKKEVLNEEITNNQINLKSDTHISTGINSTENPNQNISNKVLSIKTGNGLIYSLSNILLILPTLFIPVLFPFGLAFYFYLIILKNSYKYEFYDDKIIINSGILTKSQIEIKYSNIKQVILNSEFLFQRLLKEGDLIIFTDGSGSYDGAIYSIKDYEIIYKKLNELIDENSQKKEIL